MKHFSLKMLLLCLLAPVLLYYLSLTPLESYLQNRYAKEIEESYLGDARMLLAGGMRMQEAVSRQIESYIKKRAPLAWGVNSEILISTRRGTLIYPVFYEEEASLAPLSQDEIAAENFSLMNEEVVVKVDLTIDSTTPLSKLFMGAYLLLFAGILWAYYLASHRRVRIEERRKALEMKGLMEKAGEYESSLKRLDEERRALSAAYERLNDEIRDGKRKADENEEELMNEIIQMEEAIDANRQALEKLREENDDLKGIVQRQEKTKRRPREAEIVQKRFKTLYKNLIVNPRAVEGFLEFNDDMRIKCEEVIHLLNHDPKAVSIKRKVFTKKTTETVLEVTFAYSGRLYFRHTAENRIEILVIGAKATQARDLAFIDSIAPDA